MLHAHETSHFFANVVRDATLLNIPQEVDTAESKDASEVLIFIEVLKESLGLMKLSHRRN
jgi:hypothetical protein